MRTDEEIRERYETLSVEDMLLRAANCAARLAKLFELNAPPIVVANEFEMLHERMIALSQKDPQYLPDLGKDS